MKRIKNKILTGIVCLAVLAGISIPVSIRENKSSDKKIFTNHDSSDETGYLENSDFQVCYIDVGQTDRIRAERK